MLHQKTKDPHSFSSSFVIILHAMGIDSMSARRLSVIHWHSSFCTLPPSSLTPFHYPTLPKKASSSAPHSWKCSPNSFTTEYRHHSTLNHASRLNAVLTRRNYTSPSTNRQRDREAPSPAAKAEFYRLQTIFLHARGNYIVSGSLKDGDMTREARTKRTARLSTLRAELQQCKPQLAWWEMILEKGPKEIKGRSDFYEHARVVKEGLNRDAESEQPVWTHQERAALENYYNEYESRLPKSNRWYNRITWWPSFILTVILNLIL